MPDSYNEAMRAIGSHPGVWQIAPPPTDSDLVSVPVAENAGPLPTLTYHGGPTMPKPKLVALYSGRFWGDRAKNDQFLKEIMEYGYLSKLAPFGSGNGTLIGIHDIPAPASGAIVDSDCQRMIAAYIATPGAEQPDPNTLYMLILPDGVKVSFDGQSASSCAQFCGYHSSTPAFIYSVQPANTCQGCNQGNPQDGLQMVEAHEIAEAVTDPRGTGWYNDQTGQENADEVAWIEMMFGGWVVQGYGANAAGNAVGDYVVPSVPVPVPQPKPPPPPPPPPKPKHHKRFHFFSGIVEGIDTDPFWPWMLNAAVWAVDNKSVQELNAILDCAQAFFGDAVDEVTP